MYFFKQCRNFSFEKRKRSGVLFKLGDFERSWFELCRNHCVLEFQTTDSWGDQAFTLVFRNSALCYETGPLCPCLFCSAYVNLMESIVDFYNNAFPSKEPRDFLRQSIKLMYLMDQVTGVLRRDKFKEKAKLLSRRQTPGTNTSLCCRKGRSWCKGQIHWHLWASKQPYIDLYTRCLWQVREWEKHVSCISSIGYSSRGLGGGGGGVGEAVC